MQGLGQAQAVVRDDVAFIPDQLRPARALRIAVSRLRVEDLPQRTALLDADSRYHRVEDGSAGGALAARVDSCACLGDAGLSHLVEPGVARRGS